jgi:hypothetical protein
MKRLIVNGKVGCFLLALSIFSTTWFLFLASADAYDSPGVKLAVFTDKQHAGVEFRLGDSEDPVSLLIVMNNEAGVGVVTARGFSQVELYKSLIVTDPKGMRHFLVTEDESHKMPSPFTINGKDWDLAEVLTQSWARSVKIDDLRQKLPFMNTTAGWYTIEAQQPFVRYAATGNEEGLGLIGLVDNPNNWSGTIKSNTLQVYLAPMTGAKVAVQVVNSGVDPVQPLAQVPVKVLRTSDIPSESAFSEVWDRVEPVLTGTTNFDGSAIWKSESSCLVNDNYTVFAQYSGEVKGEQIASTETGWDTGCTGNIAKVIGFVEKQPEVNVTVSGTAYNFPETATYRATFSVAVSRIKGTPSGSLQYYYARTRMNFVSTGITEVFVAGSNATIKGVGTVNAVKGYSFEATAVDGTPDSFGIIIKKADGTTYYSAPAKALSGGNLIITVQ